MITIVRHERIVPFFKNGENMTENSSWAAWGGAYATSCSVVQHAATPLNCHDSRFSMNWRALMIFSCMRLYQSLGNCEAASTLNQLPQPEGQDDKHCTFSQRPDTKPFEIECFFVYPQLDRPPGALDSLFIRK